MALGDNDVEMVVASMKHENVSWLDEYLPEWKKNIYVVDDNKAKLTVPMNKGREAMVGYANLRCVWVLGCPAEIRPIKDEAPAKEGEPIHARHVYKAAFQELFPSLEIPEEVGVTCCSQFAVRRETIHLRPRAEYVRFLIFGKPAVSCPNAADCYCQNYGMCDLKCEADKCEGQYTLPPFSTLPKGWPQLGWKGENRGWKGQP
ncbi:hypothetical protein LB503_008858 [Fusarium chuoi]|nr:hypothetical protein LB503_008858 [Fusarium chuoi]